MAFFGPGQRSRFFAILNVVPLRLRLKKRCGLALNRNLPFPEGHYLDFEGIPKRGNQKAFKKNVDVFAFLYRNGGDGEEVL